MDWKTFKFAAFVSYCQADSAAAAQLRRSLQAHRRSFFARRSLRVFRDLASQAATATLTQALHAALNDSSYLIVLLSPDSARSRWVQLELEYFIRTHGLSRVGLVLLRGKTPWTDPGLPDFDHPESALSEEMYEQFTATGDVPLVIDLRSSRRDDGKLRTRADEYTRHVAALVAAITGENLDDVYGDHIRSLRLRVLQLATLLAVSAVASTVAFVQWQAASQQRTRAEAAARHQRALALAARADALREDPTAIERSVRLALEAMQIESTGEARAALQASVRLLPRPLLKLDTGIPIGQLAISEDGRYVATAVGPALARDPEALLMIADVFDTRARVWDVTTKRLLATIDAGRAPLALALAPGAAVLAIAVPAEIRLIDIQDSKLRCSVTYEGGLRELVFDAEGVGAVVDETRHRWDAQCNHLATEHNVDLPHVEVAGDEISVWKSGDTPLIWNHKLRSQVRAVALSPTKERVAVVGASGPAQVWQYATDREVLRVPHGDDMQAIAFDLTGQHIATGDRTGTVRIWEAHEGGLIAELTADAPIEKLGIGGAGTLLEIVPDRLDDDSSVVIWDLTTHRQLRSVDYFEHRLATDARRMITTDLTSIELDDFSQLARKVFETSAPIRSVQDYLEKHKIISIAISDGGDVVVAVIDYSDGRYAPVHIDLASGITTVGTPVQEQVNEIGISPNGKRLVAAMHDGRLCAWEGPAFLFPVCMGDPVEMIPAQIRVTDDGLALSASWGGIWQLWNTYLRRRLDRDQGFLSAATKNLDMLAIADDTKLSVHDRRADRLIRELEHNAEVRSASFDENGRLVAAGGNDGVARVWDVGSGTEVVQITEARPISAVALTRDGSALVVADDIIRFRSDGTYYSVPGRRWVRIWAIDEARLRQEACVRIGHTLTALERVQLFGFSCLLGR